MDKAGLNTHRCAIKRKNCLWFAEIVPPQNPIKSRCFEPPKAAHCCSTYGRWAGATSAPYPTTKRLHTRPRGRQSATLNTQGGRRNLCTTGRGLLPKAHNKFQNRNFIFSWEQCWWSPFSKRVKIEEVFFYHPLNAVQWHCMDNVSNWGPPGSTALSSCVHAILVRPHVDATWTPWSAHNL